MSRKAKAGLVKQKESGSAHQGTAYGQHLLLATAEGTCHAVTPFGDGREEIIDVRKAVRGWSNSARGCLAEGFPAP